MDSENLLLLLISYLTFKTNTVTFCLCPVYLIVFLSGLIILQTLAARAW
jgi:prepilin signal peptidase PulO-like enzyme (type II secretory pathway)